MDVSAPLLQPTQTPNAAGARSPAEIGSVAEQFEATFLSTMLATMFQGVKPEAPFHGGAGEDAFGSFLTDAMSRQLARAGGIGLADSLSRELLKLQGLDA
jgi:Rod binding domain-containing protein